MSSDIQTVREDKADIREVLELYLSCLDRRDFASLVECFSENARLDSMNGQHTANGIAEIVARIRMVEVFSSTIHTLSNTRIQVSGDQAEVETFVVAHVVMGPVTGGQVLTRGIRYADRFVRTSKRWKIAYRSHEPTWQFNSPSQAADRAFDRQ